MYNSSVEIDFDTIIREETPQAIRLSQILKKHLNINSAIDIGCGPGIYTQSLQDIGINAIGIDTDTRSTGKNIYNCSIFSNEYLELIKDKFDIAICLEVAEHIDNLKTEELIHRICQSSDTILFSAAIPDQGGVGHINCQQKEYWIKLFNENNYYLDNLVTNDIVNDMISGYHMGWFRNNAMIFRKTEKRSNKMRFHIPGLPHLPTTKEFSSCAYTQKIMKLCKMLYNRGHTVYFYGIEGSNPICTENISVVPEEFYKQYYNYDWTKEFFKFDTSDPVHKLFNINTVTEIKKRMQPKDFLLCAWGWGHQPIAAGVPQLMAVESGIGYESTFSKYRIFESYAWQSFIMSSMKQSEIDWYSTVIPNFFEPEDFEYREQKEDYFLYLGRVIKRKGVEIATQITEAIGAKLIIAGQGSLKNEKEGIDIKGNHIEFIGSVQSEQKKELLSRAKGVFTPTTYFEPFGGVSIEAAFSGTPVISTNWGVFSENVLHGITGYRCHTFDHFCWAARNIHNIKPQNCRNWAINNFSCDRVVLMYEEFFQQCMDLYSGGWYEHHPERTNLDWLTRYYP